MKKMLIFTTLSFVISISGYANVPGDILQKIHEDMRKTRASEGFNPNGGVSVVTPSQINAPKELKFKWIKKQQTLKQQGFVSTYSDRSQELIHLSDVVQFKYKASQKDTNVESSVFRKTLAEINMAYAFNPVPDSIAQKIYGFAACNTYSNGWTGVVEYFNNEQIGNCAFTENNVRLTQQSAKVSKEIMTYEVNGKVTVINVEGNKNSGYVYQIDWFDNNYFRTLECANPEYSKDMTSFTIDLAQKIDAR